MRSLRAEDFKASMAQDSTFSDGSRSLRRDWLACSGSGCLVATARRERGLTFEPCRRLSRRSHPSWSSCSNPGGMLCISARLVCSKGKPGLSKRFVPRVPLWRLVPKVRDIFSACFELSPQPGDSWVLLQRPASTSTKRGIIFNACSRTAFCAPACSLVSRPVDGELTRRCH